MKKQKNKQAIKASKLAKAKNMQNKIITVKNAEGEPDTKAEILIQNKINYTPKVSVIIPVYNVEEYLRECLDSVVNQTLKEIEIICVDDGSTDNSLEILKEYTKKDNRITVISRENKGVGYSRNEGIENAAAEYIMFLDADDYIEDEYLFVAYEKIKETHSDIAIFNHKEFDNGKNLCFWKYDTMQRVIDNNYTVDRASGLLTFVWDKIYKKDFIVQNKILFPQNLKTAEDGIFNLWCYYYNAKFVFSNTGYYVYRKTRKNSATSDCVKTLKSDIISLKYIINSDLYIRGDKRLKNIIVNKIVGGLANSYDRSFTLNQKLECWKEIRNFVKYLKHKIDKADWKTYGRLNELKKYNFINLFYSKYLQIQNKTAKKTKISVIIPVYNAENFLKECLDSLKNQKEHNIEIICVNDKSTDSSLTILKNCQKLDPRIKIVNNTENIGAGRSRNIALNLAQSEYIYFMDADDFVTEDVFTSSLKIMKEKPIIDFCMFGYYNYNNQTGKIKDKQYLWKFKEQDFNKVINFIDYKTQFLYSAVVPWNKIYKKDFLVKNNLFFDNLKVANDRTFYFKTLLKNPNVYLINELLTNYRQNVPNSLVTKRFKYFDCMYESYDILVNSLINSNIKDKDIKTTLNDVTLIDLFYWYNKAPYQYKEDIKKSLDTFIKRIIKENNIIDIRKNNWFKYYEDFQKELHDTSKRILQKNSIMNAKVSIIIPIYNASPFLRECLDSVVNQTLKEIEIICVNDGSTDNSLAIIKEYAQKDIRIKYIDKPNAGYGQSMNCGIDLATGEYIGIVEPDDFIKPEMYETLYNKAKGQKLDIVKSGIIHYWSTGKKEFKQTWLRDKSLKDRILNPLVDREVFQLTMNNVTGIYNTDFIKKNHIYFNETPGAAYQDNGFWCQVHFLARKMAVIDDFFYMYRQDNENSSCNSKEKAFCIFEEYKLNEMFFDKHPELKSKFIEEFNYKKLKSYLYHYRRIDPKYQFDFLQRFRDEFEKSYRNNEIDYSIMSEYHRMQLQSILKNYKKFYAISKTKKHFKMSAYILFPILWIDLRCLIKQYKKKMEQKLLSARIDIKNFGKVDNDVDITTTAKTSAPAWFVNEQGRGRVVESVHKKETLTLKCRGAGKLRLDFKASDKRCNGTRFPLWVDYKSIKINGKEQLSAPVQTWHDKPYRFEMPVKDGQVINIEVAQQYHQYTKDELKDVILKLNPNSDYIRQNINRLTDKIYDKITVKPAAPRVKKPKAASNQELLASIAALNARIERLEQENRERQAQLLAAINTLKKS